MEVKTDRELLELAATAADIGPDLEAQWNGRGMWFSGGGTGFLWNPLADDGAALRLAVKLGLLGDTGLTFSFMDATDCAAVRRLIVEAAAELAREGDE